MVTSDSYCVCTCTEIAEVNFMIIACSDSELNLTDWGKLERAPTSNAFCQSKVKADAGTERKVWAFYQCGCKELSQVHADEISLKNLRRKIKGV